MCNIKLVLAQDQTRAKTETKQGLNTESRTELGLISSKTNNKLGLDLG